MIAKDIDSEEPQKHGLTKGDEVKKDENLKKTIPEFIKTNEKKDNKVREKHKKNSNRQNVVVNKIPRKSEWEEVKKEQVFLSAYVPAKGISPTFDALTGYYSERKALQMILRRAILEYEEALSNDKYQNLPQNYDIKNPDDRSNLISTSRTMSSDLALKAKNFIDPMGFESNRAIGFKIATTALASFFKSEK